MTDLKEDLSRSMANGDRADCFLCRSSPRLTYYDTDSFIAVAGLGPIVDGYTVAAPKVHVRSSADLKQGNREDYLHFVGSLREFLSEVYGGPTVVGEHGRVPLCFRSDGASEAHCYHAHFLLFPATQIEALSEKSQFGSINTFGSIPDAVQYAAQFSHQYYLVSPYPGTVHVFHAPVMHVRQFCRRLVAKSVGDINAADWAAQPRTTEAERTAKKLRLQFNYGRTG